MLDFLINSDKVSVKPGDSENQDFFITIILHLYNVYVFTKNKSTNELIVEIIFLLWTVYIFVTLQLEHKISFI